MNAHYSACFYRATITFLLLSIISTIRLMSQTECDVDGYFLSTVAVFSVTGENWFVESTDNGYLNPTTLNPFPVNTPFVESPEGSGAYKLVGKHFHGIGFSFTIDRAVSPFLLPVSDRAWYPIPNITGLNSTYFENDLPVPLTGEAQLGNGSGPVLAEATSFTINGTVSTEFNPSILGIGSHMVIFEFDAVDNGTSHPGCVAYDTMIVTVQEVVLPIVLFTFNGKQNNNGVLLNWSTVSEFNNLEFEIQKYTDRGNWEVIGFVEGKGTSNKLNEYKYQDINPFSGINYYRLKQIDFDGAFEYSKVINVTVRKEKQIEIYPNPTNGKFEIIGVDLAEIKISDSFGRIIKELSMSSQSIDISKLPIGLYFVSVKTEKGVITRRIIKE